MLRGLRLNCWLAPVVPLVLCLTILGWWAWSVSEQRLSELLDTQARSTAWLAASVADAPQQRLPDGLAGMARLRLADDHIADDWRLGALQVADGSEPAPLLTQAWAAPRAWRLGDGRVAAAAPIRAADGSPQAVLYIESSDPLPDMLNWRALAGGMSVLLVVGLAMGGYLARRIYRPVDRLTAATRAAAAGKIDTTSLRGTGSVETDALANAVTDLAERINSSQ